MMAGLFRARDNQWDVEVKRAAWTAASWLVDYPGDELLARLDRVRALVDTLPPRLRTCFGPLLDRIADADPEQLQAAYVDTFDTRRRGCLHLTYFSHGDTRRRGVALVRIKQAYRMAGLEMGDDELPDHLCVVLEFGAGHDPVAAEKILLANRAGLELLRLHLADTESPWHGPVEAVCLTLPPLAGRDREAVAKLIEQGPEEELVGLSGYGSADGGEYGSADGSLDMPPMMRESEGCKS